MPIELKYYKVTDPKSGEVSADFGSVYSRPVRNYVAKEVDGVKQVIKDETFTKVTEDVPADAIEITQAEYDVLVASVSPKEAKRLEHRKERFDAHAARIQMREAGPQERKALRDAQRGARIRYERLEAVVTPVEK